MATREFDAAGGSHAVSTVACSDRALIERITQHNEFAFRELHSRYKGRIARFLSRTALSADGVEEITSETLWTVWKSACAFRGASKVSTWIFGIAHHLAQRHLRDAQRWRAIQEVQRPFLEATHDPWPGSDNGEWLSLALSRLPLAQRTVVELAYIWGHSCEEIAQSVNCPIGTVKTRLFHARHRLRILYVAP